MLIEHVNYQLPGELKRHAYLDATMLRDVNHLNINLNPKLVYIDAKTIVPEICLRSLNLFVV